MKQSVMLRILLGLEMANVMEAPISNTIECCFDGGDCIELNSQLKEKYPNCTFGDPSLIGDGNCHGRDYNTVECGWDGGDCIDFNQEYPNCKVDYPSRIGNGECNGGVYNTEVCKWDGGDCIEFNIKYPNCKVDYPDWIGNVICNGGDYNTKECGWDGGDCFTIDECQIDETKCNDYYLTWIGDGWCDGWPYNTIECCFDGGDCIEFNKYPNCAVDNPSSIGDGYCHGGDYNSKACGWDGEDCIDFNIKFPNCKVHRPFWIGDGYCNDGDYNTEACEWDGGDCIGFNEKYPNCTVSIPSYIGNGKCDDFGEYNTEVCGWDGGDCNAPTNPSPPSVFSLPPSFSPTTISGDSLYRSKQNQESYIACIDTTVGFDPFGEFGNKWIEQSYYYGGGMIGRARVASFEDARKMCQGFNYMAFTCPTKLGGSYYGGDQTFGFQVWCGNDEELRNSKKVAESECRSNLIGQDPNGRELCDGPNYHEKDGIWLGVAGRSAVYSVNYGLEKEKLRQNYKNCLGMKENEWIDKVNDGCAWYDSNPTNRCFIDDDLFRNHQ